MSNSNVENPENSTLSGSNNINNDNNENVDNLHILQQTNTKNISKLSNSKQPRIQIFTTSFIKKMIILIRELCFLMLLVLTYATFHNQTPKVSKSPNAFPFFPPGSYIKDWYRGQLSEAISQASEGDLAFVMYYAPWDAESQAVRQEFMVVGQHLHKYIHFAAINCWQPGSECHSQYSKVYSWPVLMAYPSHGRGIQYKGVRKAEHMIKFLQNIMKPVIRIKDESEKNKYKILYDALVVAYIDASPKSYDYGVFYTTALRFLERDPLREVPFLIITKKKSSGLNINESIIPDLHLELWNETLIYPKDNEWKPDNVLTWIFDNLHQVSVWASPQGTKTNYLSVYMQPGPALILFTPRNPLLDHVNYYSALHEVAVNYYDCHNNILFKELMAQRRESEVDEKEYKNLLKQCSVETSTKNFKHVPTVTYNVQNLLLNNTCSVKPDDELSFCPNFYRSSPDKCETDINVQRKLHRYQKPEKIIEKNCDSSDKNTWTTSHLEKVKFDKSDLFSPENLKKLYENEKCQFLKLSHNLQPALFLKSERQNVSETFEKFEDKINGLACKTNLSLSMIAMDSLEYFDFAERLGVDILNREDKTAAIIVNSKFETHHVMEEPFTYTNLKNFIHKFTNETLPRMVSKTLKMPSYNPVFAKPNATFKSWENKIEELTTETFLPRVSEQNKVVIVMYHSLKCAFCSGISHVLMSVQRLLEPVTRLTFARIDGDVNSLPWEYTMHHYPTILFFPAIRKSETRAFPNNVPITVQNLLSFILANVEPEMRLHIIWTLCKKTKYEHQLQTCARTLRLESSLLVSKMLREYRSTNDTRQNTSVFKRLQHIRLLQFLFTTPVKLHMATVQHHMTNLYFNNPSNGRENLVYGKNL